MPRTATAPFRSTRSTPEERDEKRAALLLAAVRMFNQRGFHATSLEDVANSLGVTKPVVYHYLGNKDQVLFECVRHGLDELRQAVAAAQIVPGAGLDRLRMFLQRYAEVIMSDFGRCVIRTADEALSPDAAKRFRGLKREIDDALRAALADAAEDGSADVQDVKMTAMAFAGALNWPGRWFDPAGADSPYSVATRLVDVLIAGIAAQGGR